MTVTWRVLTATSLMFLCVSAFGQVTNIAPFGVATQSSTRAGSNTQGDVAVVAIDGITDGVFNNGSVTHTDQASNPSWQVAFDQPRTLDTVNVWNRTDCCVTRLNGYTLQVFNGAAQVFSTTGGTNINPMETVNLGGVVGDRVRISLNNSNPLSLAEVEVFSDLQPGDPLTLSGRNIARGGTAQQTSTRTGAPKGNQAILAIDGNANGAFSGLSVTHTNSESNPAWIVDMGSTLNVDNIRIAERSDGCCDNRLSNFTVAVLDDAMSPVWSETITTGIPNSSHDLHIPVDFGTEGQFVAVQLNGAGTLELAEVEVFGGEKMNFARSPEASAFQSSTRIGGGGNEARFAIDGNTDGIFNNGSVTHTMTEDNPFWQVDLGQFIAVDNVILFNREDCCGDRLSDFSVALLRNGTEVDSIDFAGQVAQGGSELFFFDGAIGDAVRVQLDGTNRILSLAEVQVFGSQAVVPEPASIALWTLLGLSLGAGAYLRRRSAR